MNGKDGNVYMDLISTCNNLKGLFARCNGLEITLSSGVYGEMGLLKC